MSDTAVPRSAAARRFAFDRSNAIHWAVAIATLVMVSLPIVPILVQAFRSTPLYATEGVFSFDNFTRLLTGDRIGDVALNTIGFAVVATIVAQVFGAGMALVIGRTNLPGRRWMGELMIWPIFVSHLVIAFGWFTMYGPSGYLTLAIRTSTGIVPWNLYSITGMGIVAGLSQAPLAYLMCLATVRNADAQLEDAARSAGAGPVRTLFAVTVPMMRPAIIASTILNFVIAIEMLSIPLLFGTPRGIDTITSFLYNSAINVSTRPDYGVVGAAALILLIVVGLLVWLQGRMTGKSERFVSIRGKAARPATLDLGRWRWVAFGIVFTYVFFTIILVFAAIFLRASVTILSPLVPLVDVLTSANIELIFSHTSYLRSIWNSLVIAVVGGAIGTVVVALIALVAVRSEFIFGRSLEYLALFPRAMPGIIAGIGFFYAVIWIPGMDAVRGTIWLLIIAFIMRYIPIGYATIAPALAQIGKELDRGARISGADWWTTCTRIVLPLLKPALFSTFALLFIHFFKEYVAAVFLIQPGSEVIGSTMLQLWAQGNNGPVSALAAVQVVITVAFVFLARKIIGAKLYG